MKRFSSYVWLQIWNPSKVLLFLSILLLSTATKVAAHGPDMLLSSANIAAPSLSADGTSSLVVITLCSNIDGRAAALARSMQTKLFWRSSDNSTILAALENSSVLVGEVLLCGVFLCWDMNNNLCNRSKTACPRASAHGICLSAIASSGYNGSFVHCGLVEENMSVFCWGNRFGNRKFPPFVSLPAAFFSTTITARECSGKGPSWRRQLSGSDLASSSLQAKTVGSFLPATATPAPLTPPPKSSENWASKNRNIIGGASALVAMFLAALVVYMYRICYLQDGRGIGRDNQGSGNPQRPRRI